MTRLAASGARAAPDLNHNSVHDARTWRHDSDSRESGRKDPTFLGFRGDGATNRGMLTSIISRAVSLFNNARQTGTNDDTEVAQERDLSFHERPLNDLLTEFWDLHWSKLDSSAHIELVLRLHLRPDLGERVCRTITKKDVYAWHSKRIKKRIANQALQLANRAWNELIPDERNPFTGVQHHPERVCDRQFTEDERRRWVKAFAELLAESRQAGRTGRPLQEPTAAALWVLRGSLARTNEVLCLRREQIDLSAEIALIEEHKTDGTTASKTIYLGAVMDVVRRRVAICDETGDPWLFPSRWSPTGHVQCVRPFFYRVCRRAGIVITRDVRPHLLRGDGASALADDGVDILVIKRILGHDDIKSTARYARPSSNKARQVVTTLTNRLGGSPW